MVPAPSAAFAETDGTTFFINGTMNGSHANRCIGRGFSAAHIFSESNLSRSSADMPTVFQTLTVRFERWCGDIHVH